MKAVNLSGYLTDSCMFDLLNTGDLSFAQLSAKGALSDVRAVLRASELTAALNNNSIAVTVAHSLKAKVKVTSTAGYPTVRCRWLISGALFVVVMAVRLTDSPNRRTH